MIRWLRAAAVVVAVSIGALTTAAACSSVDHGEELEEVGAGLVTPTSWVLDDEQLEPSSSCALSECPSLYQRFVVDAAPSAAEMDAVFSDERFTVTETAGNCSPTGGSTGQVPLCSVAATTGPWTATATASGPIEPGTFWVVVEVHQSA